MTPEKELIEKMRQFWQSLKEANEELNDFISAGLPTAIAKRHKPFVTRWNDMKDRADALCVLIEQQAEMGIEPVEIALPWEEGTFATVWQEWKDYLAEQHNKHMKSRMERAALEHLKKLCDGKQDLAVQYLRFAMAGGYPRFFKVTEKNYEQPAAEGGRGNGDF